MVFLCAVTLFAFTSKASATVIIGNGAPDLRNGVLSDFQQSYGQVVGDDFTLSLQSTITGLEFWGLYYNYSNWTNNPPNPDDFTIRFHEFDNGDPLEAYLLGIHLGAPDAIESTGDTLNCCTELDIYKYTYDGLSIDLDAGTYLLSVIDDTVEPDVNGYWHWVSANDSGPTWWRREDSQPVGQESTVNWVEGSIFQGDRAFNMTIEPVPEPTTMLLLGSGLIGLAGFRKKFKKT